MRETEKERKQAHGGYERESRREGTGLFCLIGPEGGGTALLGDAHIANVTKGNRDAAVAKGREEINILLVSIQTRG